MSIKTLVILSLLIAGQLDAAAPRLKSKMLRKVAAVACLFSACNLGQGVSAIAGVAEVPLNSLWIRQSILTLEAPNQYLVGIGHAPLENLYSIAPGRYFGSYNPDLGVLFFADDYSALLAVKLLRGNGTDLWRHVTSQAQNADVVHGIGTKRMQELLKKHPIEEFGSAEFGVHQLEPLSLPNNEKVSMATAVGHLRLIGYGDSIQSFKLHSRGVYVAAVDTPADAPKIFKIFLFESDGPRGNFVRVYRVWSPTGV